MGHLRSHPCGHIGSSESEVLVRIIWEAFSRILLGQFRPTELEFGGCGVDKSLGHRYLEKVFVGHSDVNLEARISFYLS